MPDNDEEHRGAGIGQNLRRPEPGGWYHLMAGDTPDVVMARIDERTKNTAEDVREVKREVEHLKTNISASYVTQEAFKALNDKVDLLQRIVFGMITLIIITVFGAILKLVLIPGTGN